MSNFSKDEEENLNRLLEETTYIVLGLTFEELKIDTMNIGNEDEN